MQVVKITWRGGPEWNPNSASSIDSTKKKTPIEHLIETGGQTLEETIDAISHFKKMPIKVEQEKVTEDPNINWVSKFIITLEDDSDASFVASELNKFYEKKKQSLIESDSDYSIDIEINKIEHLVN